MKVNPCCLASIDSTLASERIQECCLVFDGCALAGQLGGFATWVSPGPIDWVVYFWIPACYRRLPYRVDGCDQISVSWKLLVHAVDKGQSPGCRPLLAISGQVVV